MTAAELALAACICAGTVVLFLAWLAHAENRRIAQYHRDVERIRRSRAHGSPAASPRPGHPAGSFHRPHQRGMKTTHPFKNERG